MSRRSEQEAAALRRARDNASEEAQKWERRYYAEHQKIVDLALAHTPKLRASNEDSLPGLGKSVSLFKDKQPELTCSATDCPYAWPCPTYLWATGSDRFVVKIELKQKLAAAGGVPVGRDEQP